ncbi:MAG: hypothetical protein AAFP17_17475 [Pseudomonadota bacterium]
MHAAFRTVPARYGRNALLVVTSLSAALLFGGPAAAEPTIAPSTRAEQRLICLDYMDRGFPSGLVERLCASEFSLPSAFLMKCGRGLEKGFGSAQERDACVAFLAAASDRAATGYVRR